jgi:hypothetical protein
VLKEPPAVKDVPSYSSVALLLPGFPGPVEPPNINPAVKIPEAE